jgi:hypothetical protein
MNSTALLSWFAGGLTSDVVREAAGQRSQVRRAKSERVEAM